MSKITAQMLKAAKAELQRREERAALKADCEKDLMAFVEAFWPVIEPATPLIKGWVLETMCDVLMAAADGHFGSAIPCGSTTLAATSSAQLRKAKTRKGWVWYT